MGCRMEHRSYTYCSCVAKVAFLSFFKFFFIIYTTYRKKKIHALAAKKITRLDDLFVHELHFSLLWEPFFLLRTPLRGFFPLAL